jgi:hypothetical protein
MKRFSRQELKIMKDNNLSLEEKATMLGRSMSSIRSKHWAILNKPSRRVVKNVSNDTVRYKRESSVSKKLENNSLPINISIDSIKRNIIITY